MAAVEIHKGLLTPEQTAGVEGLYKHLVLNELPKVGDVDAREQTRKDLGLVFQVRSVLEGGNVSDQALLEMSTKLQEVFAGGRHHTLLAKTVTAMAAVDVVFTTGQKPKWLMTALSEAIASEPDSGGDIMAGAVWARVMMHQMNHGQMTELERLRNVMMGVVVDEQSARKAVARETVRRLVGEHFSDSLLVMRLPVAVLASADSDSDFRREVAGEGYPESVVYLDMGRLASGDKMVEAVIHGVPVVDDRLLVRRLPRALVGVELGDRAIAPGGNLKHYHSKRLCHVSLGAVRRAYGFAEREGSESGYDSLSYWLAMRLARELEKEASVPLTDQAVGPGSGRWQRLREKWQAFLLKKVGRDGESVLGVGWSDFADGRLDEKSGVKVAIGILDAVEKMVWDSEHKRARTRSEVMSGFIEHVWDHELEEEDKVGLALVLLSQEHCGLWRELGTLIEQQSVAPAVYGQGELSESGRGRVLAAIEKHWREYVVIRFETIRDSFDVGKQHKARLEQVGFD